MEDVEVVYRLHLSMGYLGSPVFANALPFNVQRVLQLVPFNVHNACAVARVPAISNAEKYQVIITSLHELIKDVHKAHSAALNYQLRGPLI